LFAALEIPDHAKEGLQDWWFEAGAALNPGLWRDVPQHLWHVTLAFYGEVGGREVDDLAEGLSECAREKPAVHLVTGGYGIFPRPSRPKVFWAGVHEMGDRDNLRHLARCCRRVGHATVRRPMAKEQPFRGHVTMARYRGHGKAPLGWLDQGLPEPPRMDWTSARLCLFQSILRPEGPQYRRLESFACKTPVTGARD